MVRPFRPPPPGVARCARPAAPPTPYAHVSLEPGFSRHAEGSCLIRMGATEVLCTASVEGRVPPFLRGKGEGWVTAEYGMLPRATHTRGDREAARGKQSGRTQEIQRLIGRSLARGDRPLGHGRDDGDARLRRALRRWRHALRRHHRRLGGAAPRLPALPAHEHHVAPMPLRDQVAAVSCGLWGGQPVLDLDYAEDSKAQTDANFVLTGAGGLVEVQGTAEGEPFSEAQLLALLAAGARRHGPALRPAAAGGRAGMTPSDGRAPSGAEAESAGRRPCAPRWSAAALVLASHNAGKLREVAALLAPHGLAGRVREGARPARAGGERRHLPRQRGASRRWPRRARPGCRRWPTTAASRWRRSAAIPACAPPIGRCCRTARATTPRRWRRSRSAPRGDAAADRRAWFTCALVLAWPDGHTEGFEGQAHGAMGVAAARRARLRLRSDVRARRPRRDLRRDGPGAKHAISHRARAFALLARDCLPPPPTVE